MLVKISLERHTSAALNIKCMLADFWKFLSSSITLLVCITPLKAILKTGCTTTHILCDEQKSYFAMLPEWILTRFFPLWSPLNSITVYSSSSYLHRHRTCKAQITSVDFTKCFKGQGSSVFCPITPPENLITIQILYARKARSGGWQNPLKIRNEATCCFGRGRPPFPKDSGLTIRL